eukprot:ctg_1869.g402
MHRERVARPQAGAGGVVGRANRPRHRKEALEMKAADRDVRRIGNTRPPFPAQTDRARSRSPPLRQRRLPASRETPPAAARDQPPVWRKAAVDRCL